MGVNRDILSAVVRTCTLRRCGDCCQPQELPQVAAAVAVMMLARTDPEPSTSWCLILLPQECSVKVLPFLLAASLLSSATAAMAAGSNVVGSAVGSTTATPATPATPTAPTEAQKSLMGYTEGALIMSVSPDVTRINSRTGIVYSQITSGDFRQLHMTVLWPETDAPKPAVIFFPGGGFTTADHDRYMQMRFALAEAGFVVAAAEYRTVPNTFPALLEDGKAAVRYLRAHAADFGIAPDKIAVFGDSAGGYMAQIVGTTNGEKQYDKGDFLEVSSDVQAAVSIYGISDLTCIGEGYSEDIVKVHHSPAVTEALLVNGPAFNTFPGASILDNKEKAAEASPINHVDKNDPPMLLLHGSADTLVSPWQSAHMYEKQKQAGVDSTYIVLEGADHGGKMWYQKEVFAQVINFLQEKLGLSKE